MYGYIDITLNLANIKSNLKGCSIVNSIIKLCLILRYVYTK